jgi:hypothetical protein
MKHGDSVRVIASSYSDVIPGFVGVIESALTGGFGVTITAEFLTPGVVPFRSIESRTLWFPAADLELIASEEESAGSNSHMVCAIAPEIFGAQGCVSCDQALVRAGG